MISCTCGFASAPSYTLQTRNKDQTSMRMISNNGGNINDRQRESSQTEVFVIVLLCTRVYIFCFFSFYCSDTSQDPQVCSIITV